MAATRPAPLEALWFDGLTARPRPVTLRILRGPRGPLLEVDVPGDGPRRIDGRDVDWPPRWNARCVPERLVVAVRGLGSLHVAQPAAWRHACEAAGVRGGLAQWMQTHLGALVGAIAIGVLVVVALHRIGVPWLGERIARHVPLDWELAVSGPLLDGDRLQPSRLPPEREAALRRGFDSLREVAATVPGLDPAYVPRLELHLRRGVGPNAFALPGGPVILTDELVERAAQLKLPDNALLGVLAHEIGHVLHRHGTRIMVEQGVIGIGLALVLGDASSVTTTAAAALAGLAYSRWHETESDCFAIALMARAGRPTAPMAELLLDLGRRHGDTGGNDWLSTHPSTPERAERLRRGDAADCAR